MALILDHVNGVATDNRLEDLRIVCPNCAATLDTHCGRHKELRQDRACIRCSYEQLREDLGHLSYVAVGRKYGVSDKAVRKWLRWYEQDRTAGSGHMAA